MEKAGFKELPELQDYLPDDPPFVYELLEASILAEGCRDPLVVWREGNVLIDGYHRHEICVRHNIPFTVTYLSFADIEAVKRWMEDNQLARRNIDVQVRNAWIKKRREEGWTQQKIADAVGISQKRVSQIEKGLEVTSNPDLHSPSLNQDDLLTLKTRLADEEKKTENLKNENDRLREESEQQAKSRLSEIDAGVKARTDAMREDYEKRLAENIAKQKPAEIDMALVEEMARQLAAEKIAESEEAAKRADAARVFHDEQWKHLQEVRETDKKNLQARLDEKTQELEEAARKHLDLEKLRSEYDALATKKRHLEAEMKASAIVGRIRKTLLSENEAFSRGMIVLQLISNEILTRDDCAGFTLEELEKFKMDAAEATACGKKIISAIHEVIEKVRGGGVLRIVQ